ncbi:MAG TPA: hypothetical protein PKE04_21600, partial [Clostridia bacterium]|nr:hypothetical protein [Clostridia bacterium]
MGYATLELARERYDRLYSATLPGYEFALRAFGEGYSVIVGYNSDAEIPENAVLVVSEYLPGTPEYEERYEQLRDAMAEQEGQAQPELPADGDYPEDMDIQAFTDQLEDVDTRPMPGFARFFNIAFQVDGVEIEPKTAVKVQFSFDNEPAAQESKVLHFGEEGKELLEGEAVNSTVTEDGSTSVEFALNSFSDIGFFAGLSGIVAVDALTGGVANITFVPSKRIDWLGDGVTNPHTTLAGEDFYRQYLDSLPKGTPIDLVVVVDRSTSMSYRVTANDTNSGLKRYEAVRDLLNGTGGNPGFVKRFLEMHED